METARPSLLGKVAEACGFGEREKVTYSPAIEPTVDNRSRSIPSPLSMEVVDRSKNGRAVMLGEQEEDARDNLASSSRYTVPVTLIQLENSGISSENRSHTISTGSLVASQKNAIATEKEKSRADFTGSRSMSTAAEIAMVPSEEDAQDEDVRWQRTQEKE